MQYMHFQLLSPEIVQNPQSSFVFLSKFDSFDRFVNGLYGPGIFNFAHGIMLQDLECDQFSDTNINEVTRTKVRGLTNDADAPECYAYLLKSPQLIIKCQTHKESIDMFLALKKRNFFGSC